MTPPESTSIVLELAEIRRSVDVGNATTQGQLALLVQRGDQTDQKLSDHETRLDAIERSRWPLPSIAAVTALAALGLTLYEMTAR
ncbi:hypothetical protein QBA57_21250 [Streptomyces scabiei]|uniref:hypothetical protein n=1 Tax=Streptomyces scabiei TaxID=1930 RepID=UPI000765D7C0|nr:MULTISPECIES: hypothetical protein [Streptomyces]MBP5862772.1 hypothetical protein [Streptomyces sp. LBUM 1484]MBP5876776.1 hypothetical protein [Streptomyces sp. LBUM 1477]MBP5884563.1 hypothetical protein [Streptomyces sp. LBUM 1487]MBP5915850.1 hypothetical protein [Streptomyces sp. LBUM 1486]MDX2626466.1 hypothetical protein [Streptomyces scabiei]